MATPSGEEDWDQLAKRGMLIDSAAAERLDSKLASEPSDAYARAELIGYHRGKMSLSGLAMASDHVIKMIETHPEIRMPVFGVVDPYRCPEQYLAGRALWLQAVSARPAEVVIYVNAAAFVAITEPELACDLLRSALQMAPQSELVRDSLERTIRRHRP